MRLSTKTRYGVRLMMELGLNAQNGFVQLNDIAKKQGISEKYSEQIISSLKSAGLVQSQRGAQGGYLLSKPASAITLKEIVETLEGSLNLLDCLDGTGCQKSGRCSPQKVWRKLTEAISDVLQNTTLEDVVEDCKVQNERGIYEI